MKNTILITGGAGFIGINSAERFIHDGWHVIIFDNLSRRGSEKNLQYLQAKYPNGFDFIKGDIRYDLDVIMSAVEKSQIILHLAAQVALTTSVENPREDFEINVLGTINILEACRNAGHNPLVIYSSTNKVYGGIEDVLVIEHQKRYEYENNHYGISEDRNLDFHSPYGCSKGAADQYVRDYYRIYGIPTIVFRQSCIYGPHQFGVEDQGWIAWFLIATVLGKPITIYGNGKQVRDILYIDDLTNLYALAAMHYTKLQGKIYNIGGGIDNTLSLLELVEKIEKIFSKKINFGYADWRPGDQPLYICDIRKIKNDLGWKPEISPEVGIDRLAGWIRNYKGLFF